MPKVFCLGAIGRSGLPLFEFVKKITKSIN